MSEFSATVGGEGFSIPIIEARYGDIQYRCKTTPFDRYLHGGSVRQLLTLEASVEFECHLTEYGAAWFRGLAERLARDDREGQL